MIIGVSGKKQHGKDTVANIIQEISDIHFERKMFAGKLKQIVCLLLGCTMGELEDPIFKETPLGEEWKVWRYTIAPHKYSGSIFKTQKEALDWLEIESVKDLEELEKLAEEYLTPRKILQLLGTEGGREIIHPNIWVNATMADYKLIPDDKLGIEADLEERLSNGYYPNWIITDVRFPNEAQAVKDRGGILIRVNRPSIESSDSHQSEISLDGYKDWDYVIDNNGTVEEFKEKVIELSKIILNDGYKKD